MLQIQNQRSRRLASPKGTLDADVQQKRRHHGAGALRTRAMQFPTRAVALTEPTATRRHGAWAAHFFGNWTSAGRSRLPSMTPTHRADRAQHPTGSGCFGRSENPARRDTLPQLLVTMSMPNITRSNRSACLPAPVEDPRHPARQPKGARRGTTSTAFEDAQTAMGLGHRARIGDGVG